MRTVNGSAYHRLRILKPHRSGPSRACLKGPPLAQLRDIFNKEVMDAMHWTYTSSHTVVFVVCLARMNPGASSLVAMLEWQQ